MTEKPIDKQEMHQVFNELERQITTLGLSMARWQFIPYDQLAANHDQWIELYQAGEAITYLAERLDSVYQAQFSGQADPGAQ